MRKEGAMGVAGDEPRGGSRNCQRKGRLRFWGLGLYLGLPPIYFVGLFSPVAIPPPLYLPMLGSTIQYGILLKVEVFKLSLISFQIN